MTEKTFEELVGKKVINKITKKIAKVEYYAGEPSVGLDNGIGFCINSLVSKEWEEYKEGAEEYKEGALEEQFPSLKGKLGTFHEETHHPNGAHGFIEWFDPLGDLVHIGQVTEHCLDKQKTLDILKSSKTIQEVLKRLENGNA